ncbi:sulfatase family protein [Cerasicoccus fimbriatus]|uniref:sulfatase family protein n=1 Tax=Cerasicoccus fimbriatus TaxID=3014554 RepID=UPI0022B3DD78|nr:sulfatase-like hydrolase/transferase [Cerasicoccus sp. TK19100]
MNIGLGLFYFQQWYVRKMICAFLLLFFAAGSLLADARPNFVIFLSDDQLEYEYGFLNPEIVATPAIDRLRAEGVYFENFYLNASVCSSSRYSIYSGNYPNRGIFGSNTIHRYNQRRLAFASLIQKGSPSVGAVLQAAGYRTGFVGKSDGYARNGSYRLTSTADRRDPLLQADLAHDQVVLQDAIKAHGYDFAAALYRGNVISGSPHNMEWVTSAALDFLNEPGDEPFFLAINSTLVHSPFGLVNHLSGDPSNTDGGLLSDSAVNYIAASMTPRTEIKESYEQLGLSDAHLPLYWMDDAVRAVYDHLDELGKLDNTYFIFLTDNGGALPQDGKGDIYEEGMHVPLIIRGPGIPAGATSGALLSAVDISATIYDLAEVDTADWPIIDGISFRNSLDGVTPARSWVFMEMGVTRALVSADRYKYIHFAITYDILEQNADGVIDPHAALPHDPTKPDIAFYTHFGAQTAFAPTLSSWGGAWINHPHYFDREQLYDLAYDEAETINLIGTYPELDQQFRLILAELSDSLEGTYPGFKYELEINDQGQVVGGPIPSGGIPAQWPALFELAAGSAYPASETVISGGDVNAEYKVSADLQDRGLVVGMSDGKLVLLPNYHLWLKSGGLIPDEVGDDLLIQYATNEAFNLSATGIAIISDADTPLHLKYRALRPELNYVLEYSSELDGDWMEVNAGDIFDEGNMKRMLLGSDVGKIPSFYRLSVDRRF